MGSASSSSRGCKSNTILHASAPIVGTLVVAGAALPPEQCWSQLQLEGDGYIAGYDTLPARAGIVLRAAGAKLEPISELLDAAIAVMLAPEVIVGA